MNRELGPEIGDRAAEGNRLRLAMRAESDTVGRIGDDEFAIMLEDIDGTDAALQAAQRVMNALNQPIHVEDQSFYVGVSVGIALYPEHAVEANRADPCGSEAMAKAKQMTGSAYAFFSPDKDDSSGYRMQVEAELRAAWPRASCWPTTSPSSTSRPAASRAPRRWRGGRARTGRSWARPTSCRSPRRPAW